MRINDITILQIAALPPGYWVDEHNRCFGMALVEMRVQYEDDKPDEVIVREILPLNEGLGLVGLPLAHGDLGEPYYVAHGLGDDKPFIYYEPDHQEGEGFRDGE